MSSHIYEPEIELVTMFKHLTDDDFVLGFSSYMEDNKAPGCLEKKNQLKLKIEQCIVRIKKDENKPYHYGTNISGLINFSDGKEEFWPKLKPNMVELPSKDVEKIWLKILGLQNFIPGYALRKIKYKIGHYKISEHSLFGHRSGIDYAYPHEFVPHLKWLKSGDPYSKCTCINCISAPLTTVDAMGLLQSRNPVHLKDENFNSTYIDKDEQLFRETEILLKT